MGVSVELLKHTTLDGIIKAVEHDIAMYNMCVWEFANIPEPGTH